MYFSLTCWTYIWIWRRKFAFFFFLCYTFIGRLDNVFVNWKIPFFVTGVIWFHLFVCKTTAFLYLSWILWTPLSVMIGWVEFFKFEVCYTFFTSKYCAFEWNQFEYIEICFLQLFYFYNLPANWIFTLSVRISYDDIFIWSNCRSVWVWCWEGNHLYYRVHFPVILNWVSIHRILIESHLTYCIK
jgi:hypothetical protein